MTLGWVLLEEERFSNFCGFSPFFQKTEWTEICTENILKGRGKRCNKQGLRDRQREKIDKKDYTKLSSHELIRKKTSLARWQGKDVLEDEFVTSWELHAEL